MTTNTTTRTTTARRRPALLALLLVLGAAVTAVASALNWWTQQNRDALAGTFTTTATGSRVAPQLLPVALVALAGFGAALATSGALRRLVGVVLVLAGAWAGMSAVRSLLRQPPSLREDLVRPVEISAPAQLHLPGPLLGTAGGLLIVVAGALLLTGFGARRTLGNRYDAPAPRRRRPPTVPTVLTEPAVPTVPTVLTEPAAPTLPTRGTGPADTGHADPAADADAAAGWWKALDAGDDPTGR